MMISGAFIIRTQIDPEPYNTETLSSVLCIKSKGSTYQRKRKSKDTVPETTPIGYKGEHQQGIDRTESVYLWLGGNVYLAGSQGVRSTWDRITRRFVSF
jgi:hypothetical protein